MEALEYSRYITSISNRIITWDLATGTNHHSDQYIIMMYSALAELAVDCIRILLIAYAVYDLSRYCIRTTSDPANPLLGFTSDYLGELARYI